MTAQTGHLPPGWPTYLFAGLWLGLNYVQTVTSSSSACGTFIAGSVTFMATLSAWSQRFFFKFFQICVVG